MLLAPRKDPVFTNLEYQLNLRDIFLNRSLPQGLAQQLAEALRQRILMQQLAAGSQLPASRQLAVDLKISRNTVNTALDQLRAQGYLQSRTGSGVFVCDHLPQKDLALNREYQRNLQHWPPTSSYGRKLQELAQSSDATDVNANLPFTLGLPDTRAFPHKIWQQLLRRHSDRRSLMGYHCPQGYLPLRETLATYLNSSRGLRCAASQIIITQGAQQALTLAAQVLLNPGDTALIEEPGYLGARKAFASAGARLHPLTLGTNGLDTANLTSPPLVPGADRPASILYCTPTHQYPMGGILPAADRLALLDWAEQQQCWILEDDYDSEFHYYSQPIAAIAGMAEQTPVIYMGSFSKTLMPGVRVGYLVVPKHLAGAFSQAKDFNSGETPLLTQAVVADFVEEGHFVRHLRRMRHLYQQKWEHMRELSEQYLTGLMTPIARSAGMHLALAFTDQTRDDKQLSREFTQKGYGNAPLSAYYHLEAQQKGLVLGFANTTTQERTAGIKALAELLT